MIISVDQVDQSEAGFEIVIQVSDFILLFVLIKHLI